MVVVWTCRSYSRDHDHRVCPACRRSLPSKILILNFPAMSSCAHIGRCHLGAHRFNTAMTLCPWPTVACSTCATQTHTLPTSRLPGTSSMDHGMMGRSWWRRRLDSSVHVLDLTEHTQETLSTKPHASILVCNISTGYGVARNTR